MKAAITASLTLALVSGLVLTVNPEDPAGLMNVCLTMVNMVLLLRAMEGISW